MVLIIRMAFINKDVFVINALKLILQMSSLVEYWTCLKRLLFHMLYFSFDLRLDLVGIFFWQKIMGKSLDIFGASFNFDSPFFTHTMNRVKWNGRSFPYLVRLWWHLFYTSFVSLIIASSRSVFNNTTQSRTQTQGSLISNANLKQYENITICQLFKHYDTRLKYLIFCKIMLYENTYIAQWLFTPTFSLWLYKCKIRFNIEANIKLLT